MSWPSSSSSDGDGEEEFVVEVQDKSMVLSHRVRARYIEKNIFFFKKSN